jgi:hypothetical protein
MSKMNEYKTNVSVIRPDISKLIAIKPLTASMIASHFPGYTRERMRNIMIGMAESKLTTKTVSRNGAVYWGPYVEPTEKKRETPVMNGTMREPLRMGFTIPVRAGATDALKLQSRGF